MIRLFFCYTLLALSSKTVQAQWTMAEYNKKSIVEDHSQGYEFPSGTYYAYSFPEDVRPDVDISPLLNKLISLGIEITDVWFKGGNNNCGHSGSKYVARVIVKPNLVIRAEYDGDLLDLIEFSKVSSPDLGTCNYRVHHLILKNREQPTVR